MLLDIINAKEWLKNQEKLILLIGKTRETPCIKPIPGRPPSSMIQPTLSTPDWIRTTYGFRCIRGFPWTFWMKNATNSSDTSGLGTQRKQSAWRWDSIWLRENPASSIRMPLSISKKAPTSKGSKRALDNVRVERFFRTMNYDMIYTKEFEFFRELRSPIKHYIRYTTPTCLTYLLGVVDH